MLTTYFDTNAFDTIQRCGGRSPGLFAEISAAIGNGRLRVIIGLQVLDETIAAYPSRPVVVLERLDLIEALSDLSCTTAPAPDILRQDVIAILSGKSLLAPYVAAPPDLRILRAALQHPNCDLSSLLAPNRALAHSSAETLQACRAEVQQKLRGRGWPGSSFATLLATEDWLLQSLVDGFFGPGALPTPVLRGLLQSRAVRMYQGVTLSLFYSTSVENRAPRESDFMDLQHAVSASAADGLATEDAGLASCVGRIPFDNFDVWFLEELRKIVA